ncbi:MAG: T9SS C-terminal target domain-containing protein [candidate division KSB1 bacterium]|nr:T9SS C-terminal target domain-containing protein [candidate division KSB1 bacterium]MDZ7336035.1 T9SS C-terminal target domain-containing protein [candidate division KSB1 bacterium]MDZ7358037.1 T9SS C-terminal target domain-containing protein [candidate division KSB1 bacterium]MDZ7375349.1 T9SS C-terminal target domain-containing protein [candidate division KSB1 bacterium]MDZ7401087.1 T9SS C-terminal target domain-containing protein [candidate division KSB1 bacterium]
MRRIGFFLLILMVWLGDGHCQVRDWRVHRRGMLHQTVFNTGELGRAYNAGGTILPGSPSMEWPPYSSMVLDRRNYPGQHNSFGSGIWIAGTRPSGRKYAFCGAVSNTSGDPVPVVGVYSIPLDLQRIENYPVLENGELNPNFNPDEAEEIIISAWDTPVGIRVTRTSRAWSYPGYDSFIIYEYQFENVTADTITDLFFTFANTFAPSMFGYQRNHGNWSESAFRGQPPAGLGDHFARFDLKRWMSYNHERDGLPDPDFFEKWSQPGDRGGLNSPQAVGIMVLYYDYDHLSRRDQTRQVFLAPTDSIGMWDENGKAKQPFLLRYENGNLPAESKTMTWMDPSLARKTGIWQGKSDSTRFHDQFEPALWPYWKGRTKSSVNLSWWQPVARAYGFYPYILPPGDKMRFSVAELVGYGPGVATDRKYKDLGGAVRAGVDAGAYFHPVPSWFDTLQYPNLGNKNYIGSTYLRDHPLPWYVTPGVVSIRDVADRAIELYTGRPLIKYDTLQYKPEEAPATGRYNTIPIPFPAPAIRVEDTRAAANRIIWGPQVEKFNTPRLRAPFSHYEVLRAPHPLGPWKIIATVYPGDPVYFKNGEYSVLDPESNLGDNVAYAVVSVDGLGGRSGMTNLTLHETQAPPAETLGKVYVVPNPLIVSSGLAGSDPGGEINDRIQFMGLTRRCTIRIFSYTGQLIMTIEHEQDTYGNPWYQLSYNNQIIASGVYYFVVEDRETKAKSKGKFIVIH